MAETRSSIAETTKTSAPGSTAVLPDMPPAEEAPNLLSLTPETPPTPSTRPSGLSGSAAEGGGSSGGGGSHPMGLKPGVGRPRADGAPKKTDKPEPMTVPAAPYKRYYSNNPNPSQQPAAALSWINKLPEWSKKRLMWYIERHWPVLNYISDDDKAQAKTKGLEVDYNYIDKFGDPLENIMELQDRYGAGDYHVTVNDAMNGASSRTILEIWVRENWRDIKTHPPTDRRIDDPAKSLSMDEKGNAPYILYLKSQGKLPGQVKEQTNMAEVTAVGQMTSIMGRVIDKAMDDKNSRPSESETTTTVVKGVVDIMKDTMTQARDMLPKQQDPLETVGKVVDMMDKLRPARDINAPPPQSGESALLSTFMTQLMSMNDKILLIQSERVSSMEKMVNRLMENNASANTGAGGSGGGNGKAEGADDDTEGLGRFLKIADMLGFRKPGGASAVAENPGIDYKAMIPEVIDGVAKLGDVFLRGWQIKLMAEAAQRGQPFVVPQQQQQAPPPPPPPATAAELQPGAGAGAEEEEETMQLTMFLKMIETPFLSHFHDGLGGASFANWLIDGYKRSTYEQIKEHGPQVMKAILMNYPPIANAVKGKEKLLDKFVEEFCDEAKVNEAAGFEDEEEGAGAGAVAEGSE